MRTALRFVFALVVLAIIAFGFYLTGSPSENRLFREDELRVRDLDTLRRAIVDHHRNERAAPTSLKLIIDACKNRSDYRCAALQGIDPDAYEYSIKDEGNFQLCTTFKRAAQIQQNRGKSSSNPRHHGPGRSCYDYELPKLSSNHSSSSTSGG